MNKLLLITCLIALQFKLSAQTDTTTNLVNKVTSSVYLDQAKRFFTAGDVRAALVQSREAFNKDPNSFKAAYWIGRCQYELSNYGIALKYARIAIKLKNENDPEVNFLMGQSYHRSELLDSAIIQYNLALNEFPKLRADELSVKRCLYEAVRAKEWSEKPIVNARSLYTGDVNSGFNDYAPILYDGGKRMFFASRRSNTTGGMVNPDDQMFFEDVYSAVWDDKRLEWDSVRNDFKHLNSDGFDAVSAVSTDGQMIYVTVNNTLVPKQKKTTMSSDIMISKRTSHDDWSTPKSIGKEINSSFYDGSATLTADGNTMYFVSERKGTKGRTDLWVAYKNGNVWSKPVNLGDKINTKGQETTPYISADGTHLFFSSDSREGMGGFDIYVTEYDGTNWAEPVNLGAGINSVNDDTHFKYYPEYKKAVMSAVRLIDTKSSYDIFSVDMGSFVYPKFVY